MASMLMSLASGRNSINPTIAHMGNVRAHCAFQSRLNSSMPLTSRRVLQPLVHTILDDKSRPATLVEDVNSRRNNARNVDAAKRRGLDPFETDVEPLKYSPLNRPTRFATSERRQRESQRPRTEHGLLLPQYVLAETDLRAINNLRSSSKEVNQLLETMGEAHARSDYDDFEDKMNSFLNLLIQATPWFQHLVKAHHPLPRAAVGNVDIYWNWGVFKNLHQALYKCLGWAFRWSDWTVQLNLLISIQEIEEFAVESRIKLDGMRSMEASFENLLNALLARSAARAGAQHSAQPTSTTISQPSNNNNYGDVDMLDISTHLRLVIGYFRSATVCNGFQKTKTSFLKKLKKDPKRVVDRADLSHIMTGFSRLSDYAAIGFWAADDIEKLFAAAQPYIQQLADLRNEINEAVEGSILPKNGFFYDFRLQLKQILIMFSKFNPALLAKPTTTKMPSKNASPSSASTEDVDMEDSVQLDIATPQHSSNASPPSPNLVLSDESQKSVEKSTESGAGFGSSVGSLGTSTASSSTAASSATSLPDASPTQPDISLASPSAKVEQITDVVAEAPPSSTSVSPSSTTIVADSATIPNTLTAVVSVESTDNAPMAASIALTLSDSVNESGVEASLILPQQPVVDEIGGNDVGSAPPDFVPGPASGHGLKDSVEDCTSVPSSDHNGQEKAIPANNDASSEERLFTLEDVKSATFDDVKYGIGPFAPKGISSSDHLSAIFANDIFRKQYVAAVANLTSTMVNKGHTDTEDTNFLRRGCSYIILASRKQLISSQQLMRDQPIVDFKHAVGVLRFSQLDQCSNTDYNHEAIELGKDALKADGILEGKREHVHDPSSRKKARPRATRRNA